MSGNSIDIAREYVNNVTSNLNKFKTEKRTKDNSIVNLAKYLSEIDITKNVYQKNVEKFKLYLKDHPDIIDKFVADYNNNYFNPEYTKEEKRMCENIQSCKLWVFYIIDCHLNNVEIPTENKSLKFLEQEVINNSKPINTLIDYIEKFHDQPVIKTKPNIVLTPVEHEVLYSIYKGNNVPQIASERSVAKCTIENHKKKICKKFDEYCDKSGDAEFCEFKNKKALAKLHFLAQKILA